MRITKLYIDKAKYKAVNESGCIVWIDVDYWNNKYSLSESDSRLEHLAKDLLKRKHKVNFAYKLFK